MRRILFSLLSAVLVCGVVQGYVLFLDAPEDIRAGVPLMVNGTTTFPVGTQFDIVLYKLQFTAPEELARRMIIVDDSKEFDATFTTTGLQAGRYKVEIQFLEEPGSKLGSDSVTLKQVEIIDRSGEIILTAPLDQTLGQALLIEGYIPKIGVATITLKISGPDGFSLPPQNIRTTTRPGGTDGYFSYSLPLELPGNYYVEIYDREGFMATMKYSIERPVPAASGQSGSEIPAVTPISTPGLPFPLAGMAAGLVIATAFGVRKRNR